MPSKKKSHDGRPKQQSQSKPRPNLREIASSTLEKIEAGSYELNGVTYDLTSDVEYLKQNTEYYAPDSELGNWSTSNIPDRAETISTTRISLLEISTLKGARRLSTYLASSSIEDNQKIIGVLNFASAKNPGGGFIRGAQAQEESLARSSTLYPSLMTSPGKAFYSLHKKDPKDGYYSHAMIYSPRVLFFRDDTGGWKEPIQVDILVSAAVNAGVARRKLAEIGSTDESEIESTMKERMARVLYLFEKKGVKNLVLGSFGTGVFRNKVELVASIWLELLVGESARFGKSFDRVVFAVIGGETFKKFGVLFQSSHVTLVNDL